MTSVGGGITRESADVAIVGGGVPGLVLAAELARQSPKCEIVVVERAARDAAIGRGVLVHPVTQQLLEHFGLAVPGGPQDGRVERLEEYRDGEWLGSFDVVQRTGSGAEYAPRNIGLDPIREVVRAAFDGRPRCRTWHETMVEEVRRDSAGWHLRVKGPDGPGELSCRVVVGAEGRESMVREAGSIPATAVEFPGQVDVMAVPKRRPGPPTISMSVGGREATTVVDNGAGPNTLLFDMRPGGRAIDLDDRGLRPAVRERAAQAGLHLPPEATPLFTTTLRSATVRCDAWYRDGLLLLGDAAHAMHNLGGQGFNIGVQNAVALARHLGTLLATGDETDLREFESWRLPYVTALQDSQDEFFHGLAEGRLTGSSWFEQLHASLAFGQRGLWSALTEES